MRNLGMKKDLDVLLVQPSGSSYDIGNTGSDGYAMALISEMCNDQGIKSDYFVQRPTDYVENPLEQLAEQISDANPRILGIESMSCYSNMAIRLASLIKQCRGNIKIVMGAYHASGYPETLSDAQGAIDYLCLGASEKTFPKLSQELLSGNASVFTDRKKVKLPIGRFTSMSESDGLHWDKIIGGTAYAEYEHGDINLIERTSEDLFDNISQILIPRRNLEAHTGISSGLLCLPIPSKQVAATLHTTKGCNNNCAYCQSENIFGVSASKLFKESGSEARTRSPEDVVRELEYLSTLGINYVFLTDLTFNTSGDFIRELSKQIISNKKLGNINPEMGFYCMCKAHSASAMKRFGLDMEIYQAMRAMGVNNIAFGVEFINDRTRKHFGRVDSQENDLLAHLEATNSAGVFSKGLMMYGTEDDTVEDINKYAEYMVNLPIDIWRLAPVVPFIGTRYGNQQIRNLIKQGELSLPNDFDKFNANTAIILPKDKRLTRNVLEKKKKEILKTVYSHPSLRDRLEEKARKHPELKEAVDYFFEAMSKKGYIVRD